MSVKGLHKAFFPSSVAVCGIDDPKGTGTKILSNILSSGFKGRIHPVSQDHQKVLDIPSFPDLKSIARPVDLVILSIPLDQISTAISHCSQINAQAVVIPTRGPQNPKLFAETLLKARQNNIRIIGPGSCGIVSPWAGLNAGLGRQLPLAGNLAVISESVAICSSLLDLSLTKKIGLSLLVGLGDMLEVDYADILDYLANHFRVGAILIHVEHLPNMRKLVSAARAASIIKPVIVLKTGWAQSFDQTAITPTGGLIRDDAGYAAAFGRAGVILIDTVEELLDCGDLISKQPIPKGPNLAIITNARTPGIMAVDYLAKQGFDPAGLKPDTSKAIDKILSYNWRHQNTIVVSSDLPAAIYRQLMETCLQSKEINGILIIITPQMLGNPSEAARMISMGAGKDKPVFAVWMGGKEIDDGRRILENAGIPTYTAPARAVQAFLNLYAYDFNQKLLQETPPSLSCKFKIQRAKTRRLINSKINAKTNVLTQMESLDLLKTYDFMVIPACVAKSAQEAIKLAKAWGCTITMKPFVQDSRFFNHHGKTELQSSDEITRAFKKITKNARIPSDGEKNYGVIVQPSLGQPDFELRIGCRQLPLLGPLILFGQGGLLPEISTDYAIAVPPLNRLLAKRLMERTIIYKLLIGDGSAKTDCTHLLEEVLVNFSHLLKDFPEIVEMEIDPLFIIGDQVFIAGALTVLRQPETPAPMHFIISSYPDEYESTAKIKTGQEIFIRPIKPEDAPLLQDLWETLSPKTLYYRFSTPKQELTPDLLMRLTQIDYDREIALVALLPTNSGEIMLGVARLITLSGGGAAEFAVTTSDPWHGLGVGAALLSQLIVIARKRKIKKLWGLVSRGNTAMIELARKLDFSVPMDNGDPQIEVKFELPSLSKQ